MIICLQFDSLAVKIYKIQKSLEVLKFMNNIVNN